MPCCCSHLLLLTAALPLARPHAVVADGRRITILKDEAAVAQHICSRVAALAEEAISAKGAFSISIGSGTTVAPLKMLAGDVDFSRVHVFFGNDRTEGETAGKCFAGAAEFVEACGVGTVHRVPSGPASEAAEAYEELLRSMPPAVLGTCERSGLPALDLVLLGSGADGHTASLYPESEQVLRCGDGRLVVPAEGKGGVTLSLDAIRSARTVILSAAKPTQAAMVRKAISWSGADANTALPAGMVAAAPGTDVEWLLTEASAIELPAL